MERNERLTARSATVEGDYDIYFERLDDGICRLGRYEDTGLSPDEVEELKYLHEKLQDYEVSRNAQLTEELAFEKGRTKALVRQVEELKNRLDKQIRMNEALVAVSSADGAAEENGCDVRTVGREVGADEAD